MTADPFPPVLAPDGRIEVRFSAYEARMSHWILEPTVLRTRDGAMVLSLDGSAWDGGGIRPDFPAPNRVELHLRHYPDGAQVYDLTADIETETCWLAGGEPVPARDAASLLVPAREEHVLRSAGDRLRDGFCPDCGAQLYGGLLDRIRRPSRVRCLVCEREWELPPGARLF